MDESQSIISKSSLSEMSSIQDFNSIQVSEFNETNGIKVWGTDQKTLESQALQELDILTQAHLEDGEIEDVETKTAIDVPILDINSYIKRQEELKKRQNYKRSLGVNRKNNQIIKNNQNQHVTTRKKKLKRKGNEKIKVVITNDDTNNSSGSEYLPSEEDYGSDYETEYLRQETITNKLQRKRGVAQDSRNIEKIKDDGCLQFYNQRLKEYYCQLENESDSNGEEIRDYTLQGGLKVPIKTWNNLYSYQQEGVEWLWKLHQKSTGGLLGDEMGLGKTVQIISFLNSLECSGTISKHGRFTGLGPSLIVCPATVIHQWVKHFHDWAPELRVAILHQSGIYQGNKIRLIKEIAESKGVLVTTYLGILKYKGNLLEHNWHYLILDEGHKIRNSNAKVSVTVKQIRTPHRIMMTGSPMQNNLQELWSLFDFTNPGMLGTLQTFLEHFANPIVEGGFANATPMQEATALSVATTLKDIISPYLLRRSKNEVQHYICLPNKSEQVLFCSLTDEQRDLYKNYLMGDHVNLILAKDSKNWFSNNQSKANILVAITALRKICNHPDIYLSNDEQNSDCEERLDDDEKQCYYKRSGKMVVVSALLKIWKKQKHRVLLFTQGRAMIRVFEDFLVQQDYKYLKMDGSTSVTSRQPLINKFNEDVSYDVFLLTTRVGGLGVNLTGADRVIIFDPDWNPATDTQARERAWRIGQDKQVTIYRLLAAGTIEEKMYQRQVWKQLLSNRVLLDPATNRLFKSSNLHDLFSLPDDNHNTGPETANIFRDSRVKLQQKIDEKKRKKSKVIIPENVQFSADKIQAMKQMAQQIARSLSGGDGKEITRKTSFQLELDEERQKKLQAKEELKKLSAVELVHFNREKDKPQYEEIGNAIDGSQTSASFDNALKYSEETAKLYCKLKCEKIKNDKQELQTVSNNNVEKKSLKRKANGPFKSVIDDSGNIDGEHVEGLVKSETKTIRKKYRTGDINETQDQYVLEKLFLKKGVSSALQHDSIVENNVKIRSLKVRTEAKRKADKALEALRKSRINRWRW